MEALFFSFPQSFTVDNLPSLYLVDSLESYHLRKIDVLLLGEQDFMEIHRSSAPFLEFRPKLKALQDEGLVEVDGSSYLDSGIGFGDRA